MPHSGLKCFICVILSVVALWLAVLSGLHAQTVISTTEGREFQLVFQKNFRDSVQDERTDAMRPAEPLELAVTITGRTRATGYIEAPFIGFRRDFTVEAGKTVTIPVDTRLQLISNGVVEKKSLHIVADAPVTLYAASHRYQTTDTYLALPVTALGTLYRAVGYKWLADDLLSQFAVAAVADSTTVTITPSATTQTGDSVGVPFTLTLNRGEVYQVIPSFNPLNQSDLTGSLIASDKPVALFSGHNCAYVPDRAYKACNLLVEQLPPVDTWGKEFVVGSFAGRATSVIRVVAHLDGTEVLENGEKRALLNAGQFYENANLSKPTLLTSNNPILVMQFSKGFTAPVPGSLGPDSIGDPMMILIPPTDEYLDSYRFATPFAGAWEHYVSVVAKKGDVKGIRLDGNQIPEEKFTEVAETEYMIAQVQVSEGSHVLEGKKTFGVYSYGFGFADKMFDAYGNACGQGMTRKAVVATPPSLSEEKSEKPKEKKKKEKAKKAESSPATPQTLIPLPAVPPSNAPKPAVENGKPRIEYREE